MFSNLRSRAMAGALTALLVLPTVGVSAAVRQQVADPNSTTIDISQATNVAPVKDGRKGVAFPVYASPAVGKPLATLVNGKNVFGRVVFTVLEDQGDWLKVRAPMRVNGGVGYIPAVTIGNRFNHDWKISVQISTRTMTVTKGGLPFMTEKVAVGAKKTPTPVGMFFTEDLLKPKRATGAYGAFAYGLSGFSPVYQKFGSGDGRIGLHGTNQPALLGQAISNGCIRVSNAAIIKLTSVLPLGVPVEVIA